MRGLAILEVQHDGMKNTEKHNALQNMLNYNTSTRTVLHGTKREAVTRKLAIFDKEFLALRHRSRWEEKFKLNFLLKSLARKVCL